MSSGPQHAKTWTPPEPLHLWPSPASRRDEAFAHDWEPDISPTARHNILFFWAAPTWNSRSPACLLFPLPACSERQSFTREGELCQQSAPICPRCCFWLRISCRLFSWWRIKTCPDQIDWEKTWTGYPFQISFLSFFLILHEYAIVWISPDTFASESSCSMSITRQIELLSQSTSWDLALF